ALGQDALVSAGTGLDMALSGTGQMDRGAVMVSGIVLSLTGSELSLAPDAVISTGRTGNIALDRLALNGGIVQATGALAVDSESLTFSGGGILSDAALGLT